MNIEVNSNEMFMINWLTESCIALALGITCERKLPQKLSFTGLCNQKSVLKVFSV